MSSSFAALSSTDLPVEAGTTPSLDCRNRDLAPDLSSEHREAWRIGVKRVVAWLGSLALLVATPFSASASTVSGGIAGLGTGESSSPTSGFGHLDTSQCVVGAIPVSASETTYYRCTLEYDITNVPANAVVTSATLNLYTDPSSPCASTPCGMILSGYVGDAATSLADLTAGSPIGEETMGTGAYSHFDVKTFVKSVLAGPDVPIAGFNLAGDLQNPAGAWTVVGHPAGANPPTLVINYSIPVQLKVVVQGSGSIAAEGSSINCPGTCVGTFLPGATVTLHALPSAGFALGHWESTLCAHQGDVCSFPMPNVATAVTAVFVSTAPPSAGPSPSAKPAPTPRPSHGPTAPPASDAAPTSGPSAADTQTATSEPAAPSSGSVQTPLPAGPASSTGDGGSPVLLIVIVAVLAIGAGVGAWFFSRRRASGAGS